MAGAPEVKVSEFKCSNEGCPWISPSYRGVLRHKCLCDHLDPLARVKHWDHYLKYYRKPRKSAMSLVPSGSQVACQNEGCPAILSPKGVTPHTKACLKRSPAERALFWRRNKSQAKFGKLPLTKVATGPKLEEIRTGSISEVKDKILHLVLDLPLALVINKLGELFPEIDIKEVKVL